METTWRSFPDRAGCPELPTSPEVKFMETSEGVATCPLKLLPTSPEVKFMETRSFGRCALSGGNFFPLPPK